MEVTDTRRRNLEYLVRKAGKPADLARKSPLSPSYISVVLRGAPSGRGNPRQMGSSMARKVEKAINLGHGWFDTPHPELWGDAPPAAEAEETNTIERRYTESDMAPEIMQGDTVTINTSIPLARAGIKITAWDTSEGLRLGRHFREGDKDFLYHTDKTRQEITCPKRQYLGCVTQAVRYY